jgi:polyisoprenoid-binding protein YceI
MKRTLILTFLLVASSLVHAQLTDGSHTVSLTESVITWKVGYSIGTKGHEGTLNLTSGSMLVKDGIIQGGNFTIDMNSVRATDMTGEGAKDLEDHLKGDDFLSTKKSSEGLLHGFKFAVRQVKLQSQVKVRTSLSVFAIPDPETVQHFNNTITFPAHRC